MFGIRKEIFSTFILLITGTIFFVALFFPLSQILPIAFHGFIPAFLENKSLLIYLQGHLDFFLLILPVTFFIVLVIALWRK